MRARLLFIIVAIVLVGGFAAQNWPEFTRTSPLTFGFVVSQAPLGLILLGAFALTLLVFLVSSAVQESRNLIQWNRHAKALQVQRDLADRAEASRFTELRQYIETHLRDGRQRDMIGSTEFEKSIVQGQRELRAQLDQMNRALTAQLSELQSRLDSRLPRETVVTESSPLPREQVVTEPSPAPSLDGVTAGDHPVVRRRMNV